jgi:hypothetical protein
MISRDVTLGKYSVELLLGTRGLGGRLERNNGDACGTSAAIVLKVTQKTVRISDGVDVGISHSGEARGWPYPDKWLTNKRAYLSKDGLLNDEYMRCVQGKKKQFTVRSFGVIS